MAEQERGRCVSCGFVGRHAFEWYEVSQDERDTGRLYTATPDGRRSRTTLGCIKNAANLVQERGEKLTIRLAGRPIADAEGIVDVAAEYGALRDVLTTDRQCSKWYPYTQGFSPKEHVEELRMMQLEEDRRKHDLSLAQLQSQSDERAVSIAESLHQVTVSLKDVTVETGRFTTKWTYIAFAVAALAVIGVYLTYLFPALGPAIGHWINPAWAH
jgi:hypothetical protein